LQKSGHRTRDQTKSGTRYRAFRPVPVLAAIGLVVAGLLFNFAPKNDSSIPHAGAIQVAGSETMRAVVSSCAEDFMNRNPKADIIVRGGGSGDGLAALLHGIVDISMTSRELSRREREFAMSKKFEFSEFPLALDGIAVVVHRSNPVAVLDLAQLHGIFAGKIRNWRELQGADSEIVAFARAAGSGTASLFGARVLGEDAYGDSIQHLPANDAIVREVAAHPGAIGYADLGAVRAGGDRIKVVALRRDAQSAPAATTPDEILSGRYPLTRTLTLTTAGDPPGIAKAFIDFCLSANGQALLQRAGYVGIKPAAP
jgi:phosphate transport system substrate-binding protein